MENILYGIESVNVFWTHRTDNDDKVNTDDNNDDSSMNYSVFCDAYGAGAC